MLCWQNMPRRSFFCSTPEQVFLFTTWTDFFIQSPKQVFLFNRLNKFFRLIDWTSFFVQSPKQLFSFTTWTDFFVQSIEQVFSFNRLDKFFCSITWTSFAAIKTKMKSHDQFNGNLLKTYSDCQSFLFFKSVKYASSASYPLCLLHMIVELFYHNRLWYFLCSLLFFRNYKSTVMMKTGQTH